MKDATASPAAIWIRFLTLRPSLRGIAALPDRLAISEVISGTETESTVDRGAVDPVRRPMHRYIGKDVRADAPGVSAVSG
jgi:hypothetical protein